MKRKLTKQARDRMADGGRKRKGKVKSDAGKIGYRVMMERAIAKLERAK